MTRLRKLLPGRIRASYALTFLAAILAILVVMGSISAYAYTNSQSTVREHASDEILSSAQLEAGQVSTWVDQREQTVEMLSEYQVMKTEDPESVSLFLAGEMDSVPEDVHTVHYVEASTNTVLASTDVAAIGRSYTGAEAAWAASERTLADGDEVYRSDVYRDGDVPTLSWVSPVNGHEDYLVVVSADVSAISSQLHSSTEGSFSMVVDTGDGEVMMDERNEAITELYTLGMDAEVIQSGARGESGIIEMEPVADLLDEPFLVGYAPVEGTDWIVTVNVPEASAYAVANGVGRDFLVLLGTAFAGLAFLGATIGRSTVASLKDLRSKARELEAGNLDVDVATTREDDIGQLYEAFGSMRDTLRERIEESTRTTEHLERRAADYSTVMTACADGDLTRRLDPDDENEAMRSIAESFNTMMDELEGTVVRIRRFADEVAAASEQVTASTDEIQRASEQVSGSVQEISAGAARQNDSLASVSDEMTSMSATIEEVASSASEVATTAEGGVERGTDARTHATNAIDEMNAIETRTDRRVDEVESLEAEIKRISDIVEMIDDIAQQTNLLALNASIEAARAGEAGEGFAVVADEIKTLAGEASDATDQIEALISHAVESTEKAASDMHDTGEDVSNSVDVVERALVAVEEVVEAFEETNRGVQEIDDTTEEQARTTEQVVSRVEEVARISAETTDETQQVSAASEEQTSSLTEVSTSVRSLADQAERLHRLLGQFVVGDAGTSPSPSADGRSAAAVNERVSPATDGGSDRAAPTRPARPDRRS
ncbi:methyl-accepting chemotaxis protein [Halogeometricum luteum]|uniref:Methyl-accepting chemotaxis protein n=1 Tax=Halogeometricum luteum TaxID=2950537 RepID=A0ABU2G5T5_9EURY|nr:methyl-accepting chemotaxis protein [Halogeometricum sp. S3BR5-2]MDS0295569.1 methyl-accepting chemotaxis protein [Halogeometricum sp. S3BR5-2]